MIKWIRKLFGMSAELPMESKDPKDPLDFTKTENSKGWFINNHCSHCFNYVSHRECMADICESCGTYDKRLLHHLRSSREIWDGKRWVLQHRYPSGKITVNGEEIQQ